MMESYAVEVCVGKRRSRNGFITVKTPDSSGDIWIEAQGECGESHGLFIRPEDARLLARVLLQAAEDE